MSIAVSVTYSYLARSASALPTGEASTPPPIFFGGRTPKTKTPFSASKEHGGGNFREITKGFLVFAGRKRGLRTREALGLSLHLSAIILKIGSDLRVKVHQRVDIVQGALY